MFKTISRFDALYRFKKIVPKARKKQEEYMKRENNMGHVWDLYIYN